MSRSSHSQLGALSVVHIGSVLIWNFWCALCLFMYLMQVLLLFNIILRCITFTKLRNFSVALFTLQLLHFITCACGVWCLSILRYFVGVCVFRPMNGYGQEVWFVLVLTLTFAVHCSKMVLAFAFSMCILILNFCRLISMHCNARSKCVAWPCSFVCVCVCSLLSCLEFGLHFIIFLYKSYRSTESLFLWAIFVPSLFTPSFASVSASASTLASLLCCSRIQHIEFHIQRKFI